MSELYLFYAIKRFGLRDGIGRWLRYDVRRLVTGETLRRKMKRWQLVDRRKKASYAHTKSAINRDGDLYLVECPVCGSQEVIRARDKTYFVCGRDHRFRVYTEDGVVKLKDHRKGNIERFPVKVVYDEAHTARLGLEKDAPWWWRRVSIHRDLHNGKDAHSHHKYEVLQAREQTETRAEQPDRNENIHS